MGATKKTKLSRTTAFLYEIGTLRKISRAHRQTLLTDDLSDNIASHSYRTAIISLFLAYEENANVEKVLLMGLLHDIAEARSNDHNWVHKRYTKIYEDEILHDQLSELSGGERLLSIMDEYEKRESLESRIVKDADLLDQILLLKEYTLCGNNEAKQWLEMHAHGKRIHTQTAKKLAKEIYKQSPSDWWKSIWTSERR